MYEIGAEGISGLIWMDEGRGRGGPNEVEEFGSGGGG